MPSCALRYCTNRSTKHNKSTGIGFHRFPRLSSKRERESWIKFVRKNRSEPAWLPTAATVICSVHFREDDKYLTPGGRLYLRETAIPYDHSSDEQPGPSRETSLRAGTPQFDQESLASDCEDSGRPIRDPLSYSGLDQCRFCGKFSKSTVRVTDKPYLVEKKIKITINDIDVDIDFNKTLAQTACIDCDSKMEQMFYFVKHVKFAQDTLINIADKVEHSVKIESPKEDDQNDNKDGIVDSITISETEFIKPGKRKNDNVCTKKKAKRPKTNTAKNIDANTNTVKNTNVTSNAKNPKVNATNKSIQPKKGEDTKDDETCDIIVEIKTEPSEFEDINTDANTNTSQNTNVPSKTKNPKGNVTNTNIQPKKGEFTKDEDESFDIIVEIKAEPTEYDATVVSECSDVDTKPTEVELATLALIHEMSDDTIT